MPFSATILTLVTIPGFREIRLESPSYPVSLVFIVFWGFLRFSGL